MKKILQAWPLLPLAILLGFSMYMFATLAFGAGFNPGDYPGVYNSFQVDGALETSGVISARPSNYAACEFYNGSGSSAYFELFNSATVATQTQGKMVGFCVAVATSYCGVNAPQPSGPAINGAVTAYNGLTWYASSTFPSTQTSIGSNGFVICTSNQR